MAEDTYHKRMFKRGAVKLIFLLLCCVLGGVLEYIHAPHWLAVSTAFLVYVLWAESLTRKLGFPKLEKPNILANADYGPHDGLCGSPTCVKCDPTLKPKPGPKPGNDIC